MRTEEHSRGQNRKSYITLGVLLTLCYLITAEPAAAYHFFYIQSGTSNLVLKWRALPFNLVVDRDPASFQGEVQTAVNTWNDVASAQNVLGTLAPSSVDFTGANLGTAWGKLSGDGQQEIVFDADGSALSALGLNPATINGFTPMRKEIAGGQGAITDAFVVVNGVRTDFDRPSTVVHELGHMQGLAHSSVGMHNSDSFPSDALDPIAVNAVPTMHPFSVAGSARRTLEADDVAALSELYPESAFTTSFGSISGTVSRCFGGEAVTGANVRAINTSNPSIQLSRFSGFDGNGQGAFVINGLPPGSYNVVVEPMGANDFSIGRFGPPPSKFEVNFATEYLNPADEDTCAEEIPDSPVNISVNAGTTLTNQNFKVGGADLAFVVDDTGSMSEEIGAVRTALSGFVSTLQALGAIGLPFPSVAIVTFKDDVTKRLVSDNPVKLQTVINGLVASGGGDCPESSNAALLTAGRLLKQNGRVPGVSLLFTDADSRPDGPDRDAVTNLYRSKGARIFVLLSGTCDGISSASLAPPSSTPKIASQANSENSDEFPPPRTLGPEDGVRTFSEVSIESGGFFAAIPGIKTGSSTETQRYINTGMNLAVSSAVPAIGLATPGDGPLGSTLNVEIAGSNTNFQSSSTISFSGGGITVNSSSVLSPVKMIVNISISSSAAEGFRDVTVSTSLGAGEVETAIGVGAFNLMGPPVNASIIGISPSQGAQGQTLDVTISGANTHFVNGGSVAALGSGVTTNSSTVLSQTTLVANITVQDDATIGFRDVLVTTGSEIAAEATVGPFLVTAPPSSIARLVAVRPTSGVRGKTLGLLLTGENTHFANGVSSVSFSGTAITTNSVAVLSETSITANITISPGAVLGFRDVIVTTGSEVAAILNAFQINDILFDICLKDESNSGNFVLINTTTGDYSFFCDGAPIASGQGSLTVKGGTGSIEQNKGDRRLLIQWDTTAQGGKGAGTATLMKVGGKITCQITDRDMSNNTCTAPQSSAPERKPGKGWKPN